MIIGLTGHSRRFGALIKQYFEQRGDTVIGFSRSNGYDITLIESIHQMLQEPIDVMINNAVDGMGQAHVLYTCYDVEMPVVSIGSNITMIDRVMEKYKDEYDAKCQLLRAWTTTAWGHYLSWGYHDGITDDYPMLKDPTTIGEALHQLYEACHNHHH